MPLLGKLFGSAVALGQRGPFFASGILGEGLPMELLVELELARVYFVLDAAVDAGERVEGALADRVLEVVRVYYLLRWLCLYPH